MIGVISLAYGQESRPSIGELEAGGQIVDHNKELVERMTSINQQCASDILSRDFSTFQACINFQKTLEKNLMKIFNENASDIEQILPLVADGQTDNSTIISNTGKEVNTTEFMERLEKNLEIIVPKDRQYKADLINRMQNTTCLSRELNNTDSVLYGGRINITDLPTEYILNMVINCSSKAD